MEMDQLFDADPGRASPPLALVPGRRTSYVLGFGEFTDSASSSSSSSSSGGSASSPSDTSFSDEDSSDDGAHLFRSSRWQWRCTACLAGAYDGAPQCADCRTRQSGHKVLTTLLLEIAQLHADGIIDSHLRGALKDTIIAGRLAEASRVLERVAALRIEADIAAAMTAESQTSRRGSRMLL